MNTPPIIQGKELRPLNNSIWNRVRLMASDEKNRGQSWSHILICGYHALSSCEKQEAIKAFNNEDSFFDLAAQSAIDLTEDDEKQITEYIQGTINRWEAAQVVTSDEGKPQTEAIHQVTEHS